MSVPIPADEEKRMRGDLAVCALRERGFAARIIANLRNAVCPRTGDRGEAALDEEERALRARFGAKLEGKLLELRSAFEAGEWETLEQLAHKLRAAGMFGYTQIAKFGGDMENGAKRKDWNAVCDALDRAEMALKAAQQQ